MCVERRVQSEFTFLGYFWQSILQRKIQNAIITLLLRLIFYAVVRYIKSNIGFRRKMYCLHWRVHDALNGYLFIIIFCKEENQATCGVPRFTESPYNYWSSLCCPHCDFAYVLTVFEVCTLRQFYSNDVK